MQQLVVAINMNTQLHLLVSCNEVIVTLPDVRWAFPQKEKEAQLALRVSHGELRSAPVQICGQRARP